LRVRGKEAQEGQHFRTRRRSSQSEEFAEKRRQGRGLGKSKFSQVWEEIVKLRRSSDNRSIAGEQIWTIGLKHPGEAQEEPIGGGDRQPSDLIRKIPSAIGSREGAQYLASGGGVHKEKIFGLSDLSRNPISRQIYGSCREFNLTGRGEKSR
jgi:hypothetical protein